MSHCEERSDEATYGRCHPLEIASLQLAMTLGKELWWQDSLIYS